MRKLRFVVCPGYVTSRHDGQRHYVSALQLAGCYRLARDEFDVALDDEPWMRRAAQRDGLIPLFPRDDGRYALAKIEAMQANVRSRLDQLSAKLDAIPRRPVSRPRTAIMVDLETMGTEPGSALVSIGATAFDPVAGTLGRRFYAVIDLGSNSLFGLRQDPATRAWWAKQSPSAQAVLEHPCRAPLWVALEDFSSFWRAVGGVEFWAHGPNFDDPLLAAAYRAVGKRPPWQFWNARCTRTIYAAAGIAPNRAKGVHHNALDDAVNQAEAVIEAYRILGLGRRPIGWTLQRAWRGAWRRISRGARS
jgi:hypothetical protein